MTCFSSIHPTDARIDSRSLTTSIQFHWNDYSDPGYITALQQLQDLQREGLISALGLCNFDTIRMDEICTTLGPRSIVSNQIQVRSDEALSLPRLPCHDQLHTTSRDGFSSPSAIYPYSRFLCMGSSDCFWILTVSVSSSHSLTLGPCTE